MDYDLKGFIMKVLDIYWTNIMSVDVRTVGQWLWMDTAEPLTTINGVRGTVFLLR